MTVQGGPLQCRPVHRHPCRRQPVLGNDLTSAGTISMEDNNNVSYLYLDGHTLTNAGTFTVTRPPAATYAYLYGSGTLVNPGTVQINGDLYLTGRRSPTGSLTVGSAGLFQPSSFTQDASGVVTFEHDATGATGTVSSRHGDPGRVHRGLGPEPAARHDLECAVVLDDQRSVLLHPVPFTALHGQLNPRVRCSWWRPTWWPRRRRSRLRSVRPFTAGSPWQSSPLRRRVRQRRG